MRLSRAVNFNLHKRILVWYPGNNLLDKLSIFGLTISVLVFFSLSFFDISFVVVLAFFSYHSPFVVVFFFMIYAIFCCFLLILLSLCLHSLLHASIETGCSLKNNSLASKHFGNSWFRYLCDCQILLKVNLIKTDH